MKQLSLTKISLLILSISFLLSVSCADVKQTVNSAQSSNSSEVVREDTPVSVLQAFTEAKKSNEVEKMKLSLSKATLETIAAVAKGTGQTLEAYLMSGNSTPLNRPETPQTRNERIEGPIATVQISRFPGDKWRKLTFIREDGLWKMDLNLYLDELYPNLKNESEGPHPPPPSK